MRRFDKFITISLLKDHEDYWKELINNTVPEMTDKFRIVTEDAGFKNLPGCWGDVDNNLVHSKAVLILFEGMFAEWFKRYQKYTDKSEKYILEKLYTTLPKKNDDYGKQNFAELGMSGLVKVISNKLNRYENLLKNKLDPNFESLEDNIFDTLAYIMVGLLMCRKWLWEN